MAATETVPSGYSYEIIPVAERILGMCPQCGRIVTVPGSYRVVGCLRNDCNVVEFPCGCLLKGVELDDIPF